MRNIFAETVNFKSFYSAMDLIRKATGDPVLLVIHGETGRGKTTTAQKYSAEESCVYCRSKKGWKELWMLRDLSFELGIQPISNRKANCFDGVVAELRKNPRPVFIDEADKLSEALFEWIRDLADLSFAPFILLGEPELLFMMKKHRRLWSRVLRAVEFGPITAQDILFFSQKASDIVLSGDQGVAIQTACNGDFRAIRRVLLHVESTLSVNKSFSANSGGKVSDRIIEAAIKYSMQGA